MKNKNFLQRVIEHPRKAIEFFETNTFAVLLLIAFVVVMILLEYLGDVKITSPDVYECHSFSFKSLLGQ